MLYHYLPVQQDTKHYYNINKHHYNITKQHNKTQNNITTLQSNLIRYNTIL